jgi:hypothetical protein
MSDEELRLMCVIYTDRVFRTIFGKGVIEAFADIYGKKFESEGYTFDMELDKELKRINGGV